MITDSILLRACLTKSNFVLCRKYIKDDLVSKETKNLLMALGEYYDTHPSIDNTSLDEFMPWVFSVFYPDLKTSEGELYKLLFEKALQAEITTVQSIIDFYKKEDIFANLQDIIINHGTLQQISDAISVTSMTSTLECEVPMTLEESLELTDRSRGLKWRLSSLNTGFGPIIKGDFITVAARPGMGKTSFLCSEVSHIATQISDNRHILWFHNEGEPRSIIDRIYQALFNLTEQELRDNKHKAQASYIKKLGRIDRIKMFAVHRFSAKEIENIIKQHPCALIVIDMLDHIRGFSNRQGDTVDAQYGRIYQWARDLSSIYAPVIGTSQVSAINPEASYKMRENETKFPSEDRLVGSKTLKQGAAHSILMIGQDFPESNNIRYLSAPKNKMNGREGYFKYQVLFDPQKVRFI